MSRKDFLKRALQVSPDAPAQTATPEIQAPVAPPAKVSTTAPSAMLNFMREQSDVHKDLEEAKDRLAEFDGALLAKPIDPKLIAPGGYANRMDYAYATADFQKLREDIASAGGNVQPIKVRRAGDKLEIVYGHRRHRACLELGLPVLAIVADNMTDQELFVEMERENRGRADLSAWEQGMHYSRALDGGLFPSLRQLATGLGANVSDVSRAITVAKLPKDVVAAFSTPLDLQYRWAMPLRDAVQKDPEGVLARARALAQLAKRPAAAEVFRQLTTESVKLAKAGREWTNSAGKSVAKLEVDAKGKAKLMFYAPLSEAALKRLNDAVDKILG